MSTASEAKYRSTLDIEPPVDPKDALVVLVLDGRAVNVVLPVEAGMRIEAFLREVHAEVRR